MKSTKLTVLVAAGTFLLAAGLWTSKSQISDLSKSARISKAQQPKAAPLPIEKEKQRFTSAELEAKYRKLKAFEGRIHAQKQATAELVDRGMAYDDALAAATLEKQTIVEKVAKSNGTYQLTDAEKAVVAAADAKEQQAYSQYQIALARMTHKGENQ